METTVYIIPIIGVMEHEHRILLQFRLVITKYRSLITTGVWIHSASQ